MPWRLRCGRISSPRPAPTRNHITDKILVGGREVNVVAPRPLGPGFAGAILLGADQNGRDVMVRLFHGDAPSIFIGVLAA